MIPASDLFDQSVITALLDHDPLVADYRAFFALLDWSVVEQWQAQRSGLGRPAHPESAYLKAFLIRIREGLLYTTQLRRFLLRHPLLVIELGFRLVLDRRTHAAGRVLAAREAAPLRSRASAGPLAGYCTRIAGRDPQPGRNRRLRRETYLRLGQREQRTDVRA